MPPTVSVIVPVFNSEKFLRRCVEGLLQQTYERSAYEILLVDNNSTDRSRDVAREYRDVRLISEPRQGSYAARNRGVSVSSGEILAFTDADCVASPSWLAQLVKPFASPDVCIVQGVANLAANPTCYQYSRTTRPRARRIPSPLPVKAVITATLTTWRSGATFLNTADHSGQFGGEPTRFLSTVSSPSSRIMPFAMRRMRRFSISRWPASGPGGGKKPYTVAAMSIRWRCVNRTRDLAGASALKLFAGRSKAAGTQGCKSYS